MKFGIALQLTSAASRRWFPARRSRRCAARSRAEQGHRSGRAQRRHALRTEGAGARQVAPPVRHHRARSGFFPRARDHLQIAEANAHAAYDSPRRRSAPSAASSRSRPADRRPRRRRHPRQHRQVPGRAGELQRLPGRRRLPRRSRHRRRRHPRLEGPVRPRSPRTRTATRTPTAAPTSTTTSTRCPTTRTRTRPRASPARWTPRIRTASRTRTAAPIRQRQGQGPRPRGQLPERAGPRVEQGLPAEAEPGRGHREGDQDPSADPLPVRQGQDPARELQDPQRRRGCAPAYPKITIEIQGHTDNKGSACLQQGAQRPPRGRGAQVPDSSTGSTRAGSRRTATAWSGPSCPTTPTRTGRSTGACSSSAPRAGTGPDGTAYGRGTSGSAVRRLRVAFWNVHNLFEVGAPRGPRSAPELRGRLDALGSVIGRLGGSGPPDLIALAEVATESLAVKLLRRFRSRAPMPFLFEPAGNPIEQTGLAVAGLTPAIRRIDWIDVERRGTGRPRALVVDVTLADRPGDRLRLAVCHWKSDFRGGAGAGSSPPYESPAIRCLAVRSRGERRSSAAHRRHGRHER